MKDGIVAIDMFCGAGGLTYGLNKAGIKVKKGIDNDSTVKITYSKNNPGSKFLQADIRAIKAEELLKGIDRNKNYLLLAGCAPCQPFSLQNRKLSKRDDRRALISYFARLVDKICPDYVLVENVAGFKKENNRYRKFLIRILNKKGYSYDEQVLNAADYGVPQRRNRYVLIAARKRPINLPISTYGTEKEPYKTVRDAISKYVAISAGGKSKKVPNHQSRVLSEINLKRIKSVPKNGGSRTSFPKKLILECHKEHSGHSDVYGRMKWDEPAPTLTCKCTSLTNGRFGHPRQNRAISAREAAALQTFPDDYVFYGNFTEVTKHIGNAVPVLLAKTLGEAIVNTSEQRK